MKAAEVRSQFLRFFADRDHQMVRSAALVPANDPTLLFTNAGMVQFKDVLVGKETRDYKRATTSQKCVRAGGKHNDLDEVGKTARHNTFFEMLGNFSFGDYFKKEAIEWAWQLLTGEFGLDPARLVVTVHRGDEALGLGPDDQARKLWQEVTDFPPDRIVGLGSKENFWMMGDVGPMGPCSEIHYYIGPEKNPRLPAQDDPESAWDGWLELWNLVFMQYERREANGILHPLPAPSIDTGAGLERLTSVLQGVKSNYDTDLFQPLLAGAADACGKRYGSDSKDDVSMRVIADHARATTFLIADGVFPDKTSREYVLRRIFRRAVRHGKLLGIDEPFMHRICDVVVDEMSGAFPEIADRRAVIQEITLEEEKRFRATLDRGLILLENEFAELAKRKQDTVTGSKVFQLYDTYGFPEDLTEIIANEHGFAIDRAGYEEALQDARQRSRFAGSDSEAVTDVFKHLAQAATDVEFLGYQTHSSTGTVVALASASGLVNEAKKGDAVAFVTDKTPFYGESGGQVGDTGRAHSDSVDISITNTQKPDGKTFIHVGTVVSGKVAVGTELVLDVDDSRRNSVRANHSATHLMHRALKLTLGDHVAQKGSRVSADRLRFDFAHLSPITSEQLVAIEDWVNNEIRRNVDSKTEVLDIEEARSRGAVAMFGEKYGQTVRVVNIGSDSLEFCGGTHVQRTGDIGLFKITSESGVAQGVRRIEAVTGAGALDYLRSLENELRNTSERLRTSPFEVSNTVERLQSDLKKAEREAAKLKQKLAAGGSRDMLTDVVEIGGVKVLATTTEVDDAKTLRDTGDKLRDRLGSGVVILAGTGQDKVNLVAMVSKDLTAKVHAGKLLQTVAAAIGGRGGGRPDMAQGGGTNSAALPQAFQAALQFIRDALAAP